MRITTVLSLASIAYAATASIDGRPHIGAIVQQMQNHGAIVKSEDFRSSDGFNITRVTINQKRFAEWEAMLKRDVDVPPPHHKRWSESLGDDKETCFASGAWAHVKDISDPLQTICKYFDYNISTDQRSLVRTTTNVYNHEGRQVYMWYSYSRTEDVHGDEDSCYRANMQTLSRCQVGKNGDSRGGRTHWNLPTGYLAYGADPTIAKLCDKCY